MQHFSFIGLIIDAVRYKEKGRLVYSMTSEQVFGHDHLEETGHQKIFFSPKLWVSHIEELRARINVYVNACVGPLRLLKI